MAEELMRRDMVKAVAAAAGGLLVLGGVSRAAPAIEKKSKWPGEWLFEGMEDQPCAIFQQGRLLLVVNEKGQLATGRIIDTNQLILANDDGFEGGLVGEIDDDGKTIAWHNGTTWKRP
jgi:hypothetical protein